MKSRITVADLIMAIGGLVTLVFSFLAFFELGNSSVSAWDGDAGAFATTLPAILGLVMVIWIVLETTGVSLPEQILTFSPVQLKATWAISAAGIMISWLSADFGGADKGIGFWLMLIGSLAMAVGAVMALLGKGTETVGLPGVSGSAAADASPAEPIPPPPPTTPPSAPPSGPPASAPPAPPAPASPPPMDPPRKPPPPPSAAPDES